MNYFTLIFQVVDLIIAILHEVHAVQEAMGAGRGAEKSQVVIDKVTPIANAIGAEQENIQSIIDGAVGIFKTAKVGSFAPTPGNDQAP